MVQLREQIIQITRTWLETPYKHQACKKGAGCDCFGLIRGVYEELYGVKPVYNANYTPFWAEETGQELMREGFSKYLIEINPVEAEPGDVLIFKLRKKGPAKHAAIKTGENTMIHSYSGHNVVETAIFKSRNCHPVYAFKFPEEVKVN